MTKIQYVATVTKMVENHGHLDAADKVAKFVDYVNQAFEWDMAAAQCANNLVKRYGVCR